MNSTRHTRKASQYAASLAAAVLLPASAFGFGGSTTPGYSAPAQAPIAMPAQAPKNPDAVPDLPKPMDSNDAAFSEVNPLSPEEIRAIRKRLDEIQKARAQPLSVAQPSSSSANLTFAPGRPPFPVRTGTNVVTSLVFLDSTGAPWPVKSVTFGAKSLFSLCGAGEDVRSQESAEKACGAAHVITVVPRAAHVTTNAAVLLEGANAPLMFEVLSGQKEVDYRLDFRVQGRGPNATAPSIDLGVGGRPVAAALDAFSDGLAPSGAKPLTVAGVEDTVAWFYNGSVWLRTHLLLQAPAALDSAKAADGANVYRLPDSAVVLLLDKGQSRTASLSGFPPPSLEAIAAGVARPAADLLR